MREIILENERLKAGVLPELGGKVRSLYLKEKDFEIVSRPGAGKEYRKPEPDGDFCAFDMSGLDDAFPNIDAETISYGGRILCYPDHGEIWSRSLSVKEEGSDYVSLSIKSGRFRYDYEKTVRLSEEGLRLSYSIRNENDTVIPCLWAFHGLILYKDDMVFSYPKGADRFINVLPDTPLGEVGKIYELNGKEPDLTRLPGEKSPYYMKYYTPERVSRGSCSVYYPSSDVRVTFRYDEKKLPWLGVWINGGGFEGDYNVALEMTNGYYDSVSRALENEKVCLLKPGETLEFDLDILV